MYKFSIDFTGWMMRSEDDPALQSRVGVRALIWHLDRVLVMIPTTSDELGMRESKVRDLILGLSDLGADGESLIRYGMRQRATMPPLLAVLSDRTEPTTFDTQGWAKILGLPMDGEVGGTGRSESLGSGLLRAQRILRAWVTHGALHCILTLDVPTHEQVEEFLLLPAASDDVRIPYEWLCQRSIVDALDRWSTEALHLEYRWQKGDAVNLFGTAALGDERPDSQLHNAEIAARAVNPAAAEVDLTNDLFWQLQDAAVDFLRKGRHAEAAALFEFHRRNNPEDVRSINNLGFCKLPVDPAGALHLLRQAETS